MPTITYYRMWCKTCNDFTLHFHDDACKICKTAYSDVYLRDIPKDKIIEQRQRYKASKQRSFSRMMGAYMTMGANVFATDPNVTIVESDAGQKSIDEEIKKEREAEKKKKEELKQESLKYAKVQRNEQCLCGSAKKYKNCHLLIFNEGLK